ncbi:hypothetical protein P4S68_18325 [Pseudoalteromonas sp. Hal099]
MLIHKPAKAKRLTDHIGFETFPKFSPDGKRIAFSADITAAAWYM